MPSYYPDEANPRGGIVADSEAGRVVGLQAAVTHRPMGYEAGVLRDAYSPDPHKVAVEQAFLASRMVAAFTVNPTPTKYAEDPMNPGITFAPAMGPADKHLAALSQGYNPYLAKDPKTRASDMPSRRQIQTATATSMPQGMSSEEGFLLALLEGA